MQFALMVEKGESGLWHVTSPELPGLRVTGLSLREALTGIEPVAMSLWDAISTAAERGEQGEAGQKQYHASAPRFQNTTR